MHSQIMNIGLLSLATLAVAAPYPEAAASCAGELVWTGGSGRYNRYRDGAKYSCKSSARTTSATQEALATTASQVAVVSTAVVSVDSTVSASVPATTAASSLEIQQNKLRTSTTAAAVPTPVNSSPASTYSAASVPVTSSGGKRGVAFNDVSLVSAFAGKGGVSWAYNWASTANNFPSGKGIEFIPMLWGTKDTSNWESVAKKAIDNGATALLGFNEPDHYEQANLAVSVAASAYKSLISDKFGGNPKVRLGSPAVTNGGAPMGLAYLNSFMSACSGCQVDFVNIHWYDSASNIEYFKKHVSDAHAQTGKPVWVTEFGTNGGTDAEINTFLKAVLPWLDAQDYVERYSYFMASEGRLISGGALSSTGKTYTS